MRRAQSAERTRRSAQAEAELDSASAECESRSMALTGPYIPAKDADFSAWLLNFSTLISASPGTYGLTSGDAGVIADANDAYQDAYALAVDPGTRTPASVAAKDAARADAEATVRPYAMQIRGNLGVSDQDKVALGIHIPDLTPTPVPPPETAPALVLVYATPLQHQLQFRDSLFPELKRKPVGVTALQLWYVVGDVAAVDPAQATAMESVTKTPFTLSFDGPDRGKTVTYFGRWQTRSGPAGVSQVGPWSEPLAVIVI